MHITTASAASHAPVAYKGVPVMTTEMLAQAYGTEATNIKTNHSRNSERFHGGTHFFKVTGADLKAFKDTVTESNSVGKNANSLILWTEKGAARHAKILDTDEAWGVYEQLEDTYFAVKELGAAIGAATKDVVAAINAVNRLVSTTFRLLPGLGDTAKQSLVANATKLALGYALVPLPVVNDQFWTTTEIAADAGVHATVAGRIANVHALKTEDHGENRLSQSQHSAKQVEQWYWNAKGRSALLEVLRARGEG